MACPSVWFRYFLWHLLLQKKTLELKFLPIIRQKFSKEISMRDDPSFSVKKLRPKLGQILQIPIPTFGHCLHSSAKRKIITVFVSEYAKLLFQPIADVWISCRTQKEPQTVKTVCGSKNHDTVLVDGGTLQFPAVQKGRKVINHPPVYLCFQQILQKAEGGTAVPSRPPLHSGVMFTWSGSPQTAWA